ncbi:type III-B CRISPR module RAMP protein Cmr6 [Methylovulum psychrotolerans]|uniref:Type III-B CRISPR module RAMP protein Cmr6 n=1 Tax=Methylovulum psychrotolerans TaxID=1704499 RepID=A0A1Z4BYM3_9GAMM|nr:type III-B CRISPR module RAMP protein Cmr6 [Methylovulum psychrotolerans]ASF46385.1 type III-B CRISPR module RAMP protein Cmr6 [Methylovulum psychrotolerans]
MTTPLYQDHNMPAKKPENAHSGLWFERFFNQFDDDNHWQIRKPLKGKDGKEHDPKKDWINTVTGKIGSQKQLNEFQQRQQTLIAALQGESHCYSTDWHFVTGMGNPHPVENGFAWHPTLAVPYLAGSAVKGLVRAWVEMNEDGLSADENKALLKRWFGTEAKGQAAEQAGDFIFFDALPGEPPVLLCDIMTPHMGKWYEQGDSGSLNPNAIPADWHEPVPVPFLAVKKAPFIFSIAARNPDKQPDDVKELARVFDALNNALLWLGAGAKTAAGYGYMTEDKNFILELQAQKDADDQAAQFAALTDAQKSVFKLAQDYGQAKAHPKTQPVGGQLNQLLTQTINQSGGWPSEDRQALWALGTKINETLWNNKNVKNRLKTLQG